ncbi:uncharacterized protein F4822DRAFT_421048 [Hypoxylon trugodes]|uniref:uncharacterized protein n=1 Tax=Hypoxylon trugodes TaxID=326681 RepID=UPI00218EE0B7|nr:uncharacterized protein F4822DRAFT_421048 [Hypoxylon trugodes]KAI1383571.1 hypothetical protein F4822DRAFT_421048 [Hypoxylon trugodes]
MEPKPKPTPKPKTRVQISLPSKPRPYRPGDGPPLAPLRIVPENDSDAFIIDKRVLPDITANGKPKLQMYYVVGWRDLPAARATILATKVHEYVSPREVEDFEYRDLLERDEEIERQEAEKNRKAELAAKKKKAAKSTSATSTSTRPSTPTNSSQKRRGRPSKAELQARHLAKRASIGGSQKIEVELPPASRSGPSLSTPQKKPAGELVTDVEEEIEEEDPDGAIFKQLCGYGDNLAEAMDVDGDDEDDDITPHNIPETISSGPEIRPYARTLWLNKDPTLMKRANGNLAFKSTTSHVPVPEPLRSSKQFPPQPSSKQPSIAEQSKQQENNRLHMTPVPVPSPFASNTTIPNSKPPNKKHSKTPIPIPTSLESAKGVSQAKSANAKQSITPVPIPSWPHPTTKKGEPPASAPSIQSTLQHYGFTPAGRSLGKWPSAVSLSLGDMPAESPLAGRSNGTKQVRSSRADKTPKLKEKEKEQGQVWVVERLEGDKIINVDGVRVRHYKVRWEGDWPPDQNPTWEPEENIPPGLIQPYLKRKTARRKTASPNQSYHARTPTKASAQHPFTLKRKYSSVAEAFAGDEADLEGLRNNVDHDGESHVNGRGGNGYADGEDDGEEEMLVVAPTSAKSKLRPRPEAIGTAFMRDLAAAIQRSPTTGKGGRL